MLIQVRRSWTRACRIAAARSFRTAPGTRNPRGRLAAKYQANHFFEMLDSALSVDGVTFTGVGISRTAFAGASGIPPRMRRADRRCQRRHWRERQSNHEAPAEGQADRAGIISAKLRAARDSAKTLLSELKRVTHA